MRIYVDAVCARVCVCLYILSFLIPYHQSLCALAVLDEVDVRWIFLSLREKNVSCMFAGIFVFIPLTHKYESNQLDSIY